MWYPARHIDLKCILYVELPMFRQEVFFKVLIKQDACNVSRLFR